MSEHLNEKFIAAMKEMNATMKQDITAGKKWKYSNSSAKQAHTFAKARSTGKRNVNCLLGVWWALRIAGVPDSALHWLGANGGKIQWLATNGKANAQKYFEIISTGGKTVSWLYRNGKLCDGDILLGFQSMGHTCAYVGNGNSFDSGHAFCTGSGEGAVFKKWIGGLTCGGNKVNWILRLKDRAHYRVQVGAFTTDEAFNEMNAKLHAAGYNTIQVNEDGMKKIQVGYFSGLTNAKKYAQEIMAKGFPAIVKEVGA